MPGGTIDSDFNTAIRIKTGGRAAGAGIRSFRVRVYFGVSIIAELTGNGTGSWSIEATVIRSVATQQQTSAWGILTNTPGGNLNIAALSTVNRVTVNQNEANPILIRVTVEDFTGPGNGTIGSDFLTVEKMRA
jgi:hypothetical protein